MTHSDLLPAINEQQKKKISQMRWASAVSKSSRKGQHQKKEREVTIIPNNSMKTWSHKKNTVAGKVSSATAPLSRAWWFSFTCRISENNINVRYWLARLHTLAAFSAYTIKTKKKSWLKRWKWDIFFFENYLINSGSQLSRAPFVHDDAFTRKQNAHSKFHSNIYLTAPRWWMKMGKLFSRAQNNVKKNFLRKKKSLFVLVVMASLYCTKFHVCSRLTSLSHLPPLFRVVLTLNSSKLIDLSASLSPSNTISHRRDWTLKLTETKDLQASVEPLLVGICSALGIHDGYDIE